MLIYTSHHVGEQPNLCFLETENSENPLFHLEDERVSRIKRGDPSHFLSLNLSFSRRPLLGSVISYPNRFFKENLDSKIFEGDLKPNISIHDQHFFFHHYAHALYAYYTRPKSFKKTDILSYDGWGFFTDRLLFNNKTLVDNSVFGMGFLWRFLSLLIYENPNYSGKIMGWSAYGSLNEDFYQFLNEKIVKIQQRLSSINPRIRKYKKNEYLNEIKDDMKKKFFSYNNEDLCFTIQKFLEDSVISYLIKNKKEDNLCISGGIGLNGYINQKLIENEIYKNVHVPPACGDDGLSIGAALGIANEFEDFKIQNVAYLGNEFSFDSRLIKNLVGGHELSFKEMPYEELYYYVAKKMTEKKIVGWFQGRSESGPRALGNRSILCDPTFPDMKDYLNQQVKHREWYRPFAPSILKEKTTEWFENIEEAPFMLKIAKYKKGMGELVPAVCHEDYTGRLQSVTEESNPHYYNLINSFYEITGIPMVLNTSFNDNKEPIVDSPEDAFNCFMKTNIDMLVLHNWVIEK